MTDASSPNPWPGGERFALFAAALALVLVPMAVAGPIPAMVDYPNHLARMMVLARAVTPAANPYYQTAWALYPDLAMDLVVPPLVRLIGAEPAVKGFILVSQFLVVSGAAVLERTVKGRFGWAGFVAALLLYSDPLAWGFVNFEFGLGVALFALAAWIGARARPLAWRALIHAAACVVLFVAHLFALGLYGWALGLYELWRWRAARGSLARLALTAAALAAPAVALAVLMRVLGGGVGGATDSGGVAWGLGLKALWLMGLDGYSWPVSMALSVALFALVYVLARSGRLRLVGAGRTMAAGFAVLYAVMPHRLLDTEFVDVRVLVGALLILPAFVVVEPLPPRLRRVALGVVCAAALIDLADVSWVQWSYRADYAAVIASFARLPPRARVLVGHSGKGIDPPVDLGEYPIFHAPTLAAGRMDAFVSTLFTFPGKQPILPLPALRRLNASQGGLVPVRVLETVARGGSPGQDSFVADWTHDFDVLYLVGPRTPDPLPGLLQPLVSGRRFAMYRIRPRAPPTPQSASR